MILSPATVGLQLQSFNTRLWDHAYQGFCSVAQHFQGLRHNIVVLNVSVLLEEENRYKAMRHHRSAVDIRFHILPDMPSFAEERVFTSVKLGWPEALHDLVVVSLKQTKRVHI